MAVTDDPIPMVTVPMVTGAVKAALLIVAAVLPIAMVPMEIDALGRDEVSPDAVELLLMLVGGAMGGASCNELLRESRIAAELMGAGGGGTVRPGFKWGLASGLGSSLLGGGC